jgi:hypothetical protein
MRGPIQVKAYGKPMALEDFQTDLERAIQVFLFLE